MASAALLWWQPWVAATCVAGFTILVRVVYPNATGPVIAGVLLLVMHLLHLLVLRREAADRLASAARAVVPVPAGWCGIGRVSTVGRFPVPFAAPIALALLSVVSFVVLVRALMADAPTSWRRPSWRHRSARGGASSRPVAWRGRCCSRGR